MTINFLAVLVCAIVAMVLGFLWYGPIFGKAWMRLNHSETMTDEQKKEMMKKSQPLYVVQFILAFFQAYVLAWYIGTLNTMSSGPHTALSIWIAFIIPTLAASVMWTSESKKSKWMRFTIQAGYQLALFFVFGVILGAW